VGLVTTCPQVVDGGHSIQIWRVAAGILNKHLQTSDKGGSQGFGLGEGLRTLHLKILTHYEMLNRGLYLDG
jgi:hypothetical protein